MQVNEKITTTGVPKLTFKKQSLKKIMVQQVATQETHNGTIIRATIPFNSALSDLLNVPRHKLHCKHGRHKFLKNTVLTTQGNITAHGDNITLTTEIREEISCESCVTMKVKGESVCANFCSYCDENGTDYVCYLTPDHTGSCVCANCPLQKLSLCDNKVEWSLQNVIEDGLKAKQVLNYYFQ